MIATVIYSYNYAAYGAWVIGGMWTAYFLYRRLRMPSKLLASIVGVTLALGTACLIGFLRLDLSVIHHLEFYYYFNDWIFKRVDYFYRIPRTILLDLLPFFYAYRFLRPAGEPSWHAGVVPSLAAVLVFGPEWPGAYFLKDSMAMAFAHLLAAALLVSCPTQEPRTVGAALSDRLRAARTFRRATSCILLLALAVAAYTIIATARDPEADFGLNVVAMVVFDWAHTLLIPLVVWLYLLGRCRRLRIQISLNGGMLQGH